MPAFRYRALDAAGKTLSGVVEAQTSRLARTQLRERGLFPERIDAVAAAASGAGGVGTGRLALATRQWAALLAAGLTVEQSLSALIEQAETPRLRDLLAAVRADVRAGHPLAGALARQPRAFSDIYRALVAAGEKSGRLPLVLDRLAEHLESRQAAGRRFVQALAYPLVLAVAAVAIVAALMAYVVPQIAAVFAHGKQELPLLTRLLIGLTEGLHSWGPALAAGLAAAGYGLQRLARQAGGRRFLQARLLRLPLLGPLLRLHDASRFTSTVAILVEAGVPLIAALEAGRDVLWLLPLRAAIDAAIADVREGAGLSRALAKTGALPPIVVHLTASAEKSGALGAMLARAAAQVRADLDHRLGIASALFEPLLVLVMGGVVLVIVMAMLAPILDINLTLR